MPTLAKKNVKAIAKKVAPFSERHLFPIVDPQFLLATNKREAIIQEIRLLANLPEEHFSLLYQQLINNFIAFVQVLPTNNNSRLGSLMDEGLFRGLYVLQAQNQVAAENIDPLITYALFSAALLFDVGFVMGDRLIAISNKQGELVKLWEPYKGAMKPSDGYYKMRFGDGMPCWLCRRMTPLLARQIMPPIGFQWIAKNAYALNAWLALLNNEQEGIETLKLYLERANRLLEECKLRDDFLIPVDVSPEDPAETSLAEDFIEWLKQGLNDGSVNINTTDSKVHILEDGIFLETPGIFQEFSKYSPIHPNWELVLKQLARLGYIRQRGVNIEFEKYYYLPDEIIKNPAKRSEHLVYVVGENIAKYGIREGITIIMPYALMIFCRRFLPYLNPHLRMLVEDKNRRKKSKYPDLQTLLANAKENLLTNI